MANCLFFGLFQILLHGIPRNALIEDVERFLSGCQYDSSSISFSTRLHLQHFTLFFVDEERIKKWIFICYMKFFCA